MPFHPFGPAYRIETPRVILRCWEPADTPALRALLADNLEHLRPWVPWIADEPKPVEEKLREVRGWRAAFDQDQMWNYALLSAEDGALAGNLVVCRHSPDTVDLGGWVATTAAAAASTPRRRPPAPARPSRRWGSRGCRPAARRRTSAASP
jgi:RimJ/RimL family protein N-acetyltransferase